MEGNDEFETYMGRRERERAERLQKAEWTDKYLFEWFEVAGKLRNDVAAYLVIGNAGGLVTGMGAISSVIALPFWEWKAIFLLAMSNFAVGLLTGGAAKFKQYSVSVLATKGLQEEVNALSSGAEPDRSFRDKIDRLQRTENRLLSFSAVAFSTGLGLGLGEVMLVVLYVPMSP